MKDFIQYIYDKSIKLNEGFLITEKKSWNELTVLNELNVQIGHVFNIDSDTIFNEKYRNINNIGDEVCDVFFQLILLLHYGNYKLSSVDYNTKSSSLNDFIVCFGQLNEILLEKHGHRFNKVRKGFNSSKEYIIFKISNLFSIIYNYSIHKKIDLYKEYDLMIDDATNFLNNFKK